jgi:antitoxin ParD1/3/4
MQTEAAEKLSITLPAEMARVIRAQVESGGYSSNSEVIRDAMRGWMERERHLTTLSAAIDRGIADADAGRVADSGQVRKKLLERVGKGRKSKP